MKSVTREQVDFLIEKKILKMERGRYPDLSITNKEKKGHRKRYYVPDWMVDSMLNAQI